MVIHREPTITTASVEAALESLKYTTKDVSAARSLHTLSLVEAFLDDPSVPSSPLMREYALRHILTDLITRHYQAAVASPLPSAQSAPEAELISRIKQDVRTDNPDLIGWSVLYHLYVVTSVALSQDAYAEHTFIATKTVYRYKKTALTQLTYALIESEWQMRRQRQRQRLLAQLPSSDGIALIGRDGDLTRIMHVLQEMPHACITISGTAGCGKSALVREAVSHLIAQDRAAYLFWLTAADSITSVEDQIRVQLQAARLRSQFGDLVAAYPVVIVLENSECLSASSEEWDHLLSVSFGRTITFVTGQEARLTPRAGLHLVLHDLERAEVNTLVWTLLKAASRDVTSYDDYAEAVWRRVGGNPLAIRLAVGVLEQSDLEFFQTDILNRLYSHLDAALDADVRRIWELLTLFPQGLSASALRLMADDPTIARLRHQGLITPTPSAHYVLSRSAHLYRRTHPLNGLDWAWGVIEQDTDAQWGWLAAAVLPHLDSLSQEAVQLVFQRYQADMEASPIAWRAALEHWQAVLDLPLQLIYATCLFRSGQTQAAPHIVRSVMRQAGRVGDFMLQASALLAHSAMCRQQGYYEEAVQALQQVSRVPRLPAALQASLVVERLHIALDQEDRVQVGALLPLLADVSPQTALLRLEACILLGLHSEARALAEHLRAIAPEDDAWVLTILGRNAHDSQQFKQAVDYFQAALVRFEQQQDIRAVSRTQMNLAASLVALDQRDEAKALLDISAQTLMDIQDHVGLSAVRANLDYLSRINRLKSS